VLAEALRTLYGYNRWATDRVLDAAEKLSNDQLNAPGVAGRGSIRETLVHMIGTQRGWLSWWDGSLPPMEAYALQLDPAAVADLAGLRQVWQEAEEQMATFLARLDDELAARDYAFSQPNGAEFRMPLWRMMLHVANHGTQHRSEIAAMLTQAGASPGDLDLLFYS
jgi:uncharacterized damage-inducible protein DinB